MAFNRIWRPILATVVTISGLPAFGAKDSHRCELLAVDVYPPVQYKKNETPDLQVTERIRDFHLPEEIALVRRKPFLPNIINGRIPRMHYVRYHPGSTEYSHLVSREATYGEVVKTQSGSSPDSKYGELLEYFVDPYYGSFVHSISEYKDGIKILRRELEKPIDGAADLELEGWTEGSQFRQFSADKVHFVANKKTRRDSQSRIFALSLDHGWSGNSGRKINVQNLFTAPNPITSYDMSTDSSTFAAVQSISSGSILTLQFGRKTLNLQAEAEARVQVLSKDYVALLETKSGRLSLIDKKGEKTVISESGVVANQRTSNPLGLNTNREMLYYLQANASGQNHLVEYSLASMKVNSTANLDESIVEFEISAFNGKVVLVSNDAIHVWSRIRGQPELTTLTSGKGPYTRETEPWGLGGGIQLSSDGKMLVFSNLKLDKGSRNPLRHSTRDFFIVNLDGSLKANFLFKAHGFSQFAWGPDGRMGGLLTKATPKSLKSDGKYRLDPNSNYRLFYVDNKDDRGYATGFPPKDFKAIFD